MKNLFVIMYYTYFLSFIHIYNSAQAQNIGATLLGRVTDAKTGQPLPFATVYVANTTLATTADAESRYALPAVALGNLELVGSSIGYRPARQRLRLTEGRAYTVNLTLEADQQQLDAVTVRAKRSRSYTRQLSQFTRELLGTRPQARLCKLLNPEVLQFREERGHLLATAGEPLVVENRALGYKMYYSLLHFDYFQGRVDVGGMARFEEIPAPDPHQRAKWQQARQQAYQGSLRHLMASLLAGNVAVEGFLVFQSTLLGAREGAGVPRMSLLERQPIEGAGAKALFRPGELAFERRFLPARPLEVYYRRVQLYNAPDANLNPGAYSVLLPPDHGAVEVNTDGHITAGRGLDVRGYLGSDRLATLLPDDWQPLTTEALRPTDVVAGRSMPADPLLDTLQTEAQRVSRQPTEPYLFVDLAKSQYLTGDTLWLSVFALDPISHLLGVAPSDSTDRAPTQALHVDLVAPSGGVIEHQWLALSGGRAAGQFRLSDTLQAGQYRLRAYTDVHVGTGQPGFERQITLYNPMLPPAALNGSLAQTTAQVGMGATGQKAPEALDVQFLPEGGRWLAGVAGRLGVKALGPDGRGRSVSGVIQDGTGAEVAGFSTNRLGMGRVTLTPQAGKRYVARVAFGVGNAQDIALLLPELEGWALAADVSADSSQCAVRAVATGQQADQPCYLLFYQQTKLLYAGKWQPRRGEVSFVVPTRGCSPGVGRWVLLDAGGQPRCERLVWIPDVTLPIQLQVHPAQARYAPHEQVALGLRLRDGEGNAVSARWSAAVQDADQTAPDTLTPSLRSYLLMTAGLTGHVEQPDWYFSEGMLADVDALLLTQGWRKLLPPTSNAGWVVSGQVFDVGNAPMPKRTVLLNLQEGAGERWMRTALTDAKGRFQLGGLMLKDTVKTQARLLDAERFAVSIRIDARPDVLPARALLPITPDWSQYATWITQGKARQADDPAFYRDKETLQLREVTVRAMRNNQYKGSREGFSLHGSADYIFAPDESAGAFSDVFQMIMGRIPSVIIRPGMNAYDIVIRGLSSFGNSGPLLLLDGMDVDITVLMAIPPTEIQRIEMLNSPGTLGIYGARGAGGVLAFFTKKTNGKASSLSGQKTVNATLVGYRTPREFYVPRQVVSDTRPHLDRRDVLYWQPLGQSGFDGLGRLNFPLSDTAKRLRLVLQGITAEGQPISATWTLPVR